MKRNGDKIVHVQLVQPYNGKANYYFGSIAAIYDTLPVEIVGIAKSSLWEMGDLYQGKKATIRKSTIIRKRTNRQSPNRSDSTNDKR